MLIRLIYFFKSRIQQQRLVVTAVVLLLVACSSNNISDNAESALPDSLILARVGDRVITTQDFIRRAEYVPRPDYCLGSSYIDKKIILNSLIAEKLLALEQNSGALDSNRYYRHYIQGRTEQAMRQWLSNVEGFEKAHSDTSAIKARYRLLGKTYDIAWFAIPNDDDIAKVQMLIESNVSFNEIYEAFTKTDTIPRRQVQYKYTEDPILLNALFTQPVERGEVIGPLKAQDGTVLVIQVLGWKSQPAITEKAAAERWQSAETDLKQELGLKQYEKFVGEVMRGKSLKFDSQTFPQYANYMGQRFVKSLTEKKQQLNLALWDIDSTLSGREVQPLEPDFKDRPLFTLDGKTWTVEQFEDLMLSHPLVFRNRHFPASQFPKEFKLAIVDLVRDHFLNLIAYDRGYDRLPAVQLNTQLWDDFYHFKTRRDQFLQHIDEPVDSTVSANSLIQNYLNGYVDSLQTKYSDIILINIPRFEKLQISSVAMFVTQQNMPYPILVPSFPLITTDSRLDYGSIITEQTH